MAFEHTITRRVEFHETDLAGIVHFANYYRYMESCEHSFFRSLGFTIHQVGGAVQWPRVQAACDFKAPLRFEDVFELQLLVTQKRQRVLGYTFIFRKDGREIARGSMTVVCTARDPATGELRATAIPADMAAKIDIAPDEAVPQV